MFSCVVLTTGQRPEELLLALDSVRRQDVDKVQLVVVRNVDGPALPAEHDGDVLVVSPGQNLGIPAGRNLGLRHAEGDLVLFLDDDGRLASPDVLQRAARAFETDRSLAVVTMRIIDPDSGETQRRHVPRLRVGDAKSGSWVTSFLGGASVVRRQAFVEVGGFPEEFFYAHEETSVGWRLIDRGYRIRYAPELVMIHPGVPPARHPRYHELSARNRVLLARRHLPLAVGVAHVVVWTVLATVRQPSGIVPMLRGLRAGLLARGVERRPIAWRTVWRLTRYGRPPFV